MELKENLQLDGQETTHQKRGALLDMKKKIFQKINIGSYQFGEQHNKHIPTERVMIMITHWFYNGDHV